NHLLAVGIKGVVDDPFRGIDGVIVLVSEMAKALGDGFEPGSLGLMIERVVRIGAIDDLSNQDERWIVGESVFFQDCLERALLAVVTELDVLYVVWSGAEAFCFLHHLVGRDENELSVLVDKFLDQPRAGDAVDLDPFACDPFHRKPPRCWIVRLGERSGSEASTSLPSAGDLLCAVTDGPEHLVAPGAWRGA